MLGGGVAIPDTAHHTPASCSFSLARTTLYCCLLLPITFAYFWANTRSQIQPPTPMPRPMRTILVQVRPCHVRVWPCGLQAAVSGLLQLFFTIAAFFHSSVLLFATFGYVCLLLGQRLQPNAAAHAKAAPMARAPAASAHVLRKGAPVWNTAHSGGNGPVGAAWGGQGQFATLCSAFYFWRGFILLTSFSQWALSGLK